MSVPTVLCHGMLVKEPEQFGEADHFQFSDKKPFWATQELSGTVAFSIFFEFVVFPFPLMKSLWRCYMSWCPCNCLKLSWHCIERTAHFQMHECARQIASPSTRSSYFALFPLLKLPKGAPEIHVHIFHIKWMSSHKVKESPAMKCQRVCVFGDERFLTENQE